MMLTDYLKATRQARYSITFALPLLLLYEGLAAVMSQSDAANIRNGADVLLKTVFVAFGGRAGVTLFSVLLLGVGAWFVFRDVRKHPGRLQSAYLGGMLAESVVYAAVLGTVVSTLSSLLLSGSLAVVQQGTFEQFTFGTQLVVSLGAGLYEELLFRVLMVSGLVALGLWLGWRRPVAIGVGVVGSALIFSAFHYVGPLGDTVTVASFTFRAVAGLVLSGLYVARGFGIVAWSHALYDVGIAVLT
jgi:hypothetical protein